MLLIKGRPDVCLIKSSVRMIQQGILTNNTNYLYILYTSIIFNKRAPLISMYFVN